MASAPQPATERWPYFKTKPPTTTPAPRLRLLKFELPKSKLPFSLLCLGILVTAALFLQMLQQLFFGDLPRRWADFSDLGRVEVGALTVMGLLIVAIGIYPAWLLTLIDHASALLTGGGG